MLTIKNDFKRYYNTKVYKDLIHIYHNQQKIINKNEMINMAKTLIINKKVVKVAPSSFKLLAFLYNNQDYYDATELSERTGIAYRGLYRYTSELVSLSLISEIREKKRKLYSINQKGIVIYKISSEKVDVSDIDLESLDDVKESDFDVLGNNFQDVETQKVEQFIERNKERIQASNAKRNAKINVLSDDEIKKLDEIYRIACMRRMTKIENLEVFNDIINKLKGVNL